MACGAGRLWRNRGLRACRCVEPRHVPGTWCRRLYHQAASPGELVARVRAVLRRLGERTAPATNGADNPVISVGDFKVDLRLRQIRDGHGQLVDITATEFATLAELIAAKGQPVSREHLSEVVLRRRWDGQDRSIDQLVFRIRHKLLMDGDERRLIQSIRNAGYVLSLPRPDDT